VTNSDLGHILLKDAACNNWRICTNRPEKVIFYMLGVQGIIPSNRKDHKYRAAEA
jgi:hypothetical protein